MDNHVLQSVEEFAEVELFEVLLQCTSLEGR